MHCHDDLGMSVANSIAAIQAGARQVEGTINGIGERAGNCALEEIAMIIKTRQELLGVTTGIKHDEISRTSKLVSQLCNMPIQSNKAIVGANAFSHSSGIHQDGMLKNKNTYEIMTPESIGLKNQALNLTSRSGRAAVKSHMDSMGYNENEYNLDALYEDFLKLADRKGQVFDYDLEALMHFSNLREEDDFYKLNYLSVQSGSVMATTSIKLLCGGEENAKPLLVMVQSMRYISVSIASQGMRLYSINSISPPKAKVKMVLVKRISSPTTKDVISRYRRLNRHR